MGLLLTLAFAAGARVAPGGPSRVPTFPRTVSTIGGEELDLAVLAERRTLVVVTLKATWCPVCQEQLARIRSRLAQIEACGVSFLVLAPGPKSALRAIKDRTGFPYPFVEDVDLRIAKRMGLVLNEKEIVPSILILNPELSVGWMQRGRGPDYYGDDALVEKVNCGDWI